MNNIEALSNRAAGLVRQLLTFACKDRVALKKVDMHAFMGESYKFLRSSIPENIDMHLNRDQSLLNINVDSTQFQQVLVNLINNSRDALEGVLNPYITIKLEAFYADGEFIKTHQYFKIGHYACISVKDNGCGISEHHVEHVFEPFFTTKEVGKGTGLGLSMVFGAIKRLHGYIEVQSIEGKGSTFSIYIPTLTMKEDQHSLSQAEGQVAINTTAGEMILLVDDEKAVLEMGKDVLESLGYRVVSACNGLEAVDVFTANQDEISLVITDIVMPKLGGVKAIERIRKICPSMKGRFQVLSATRAKCL